MYVRMYGNMHVSVCVYVDLCIYRFVSVSTFNQMQILTKLDTMLRHCTTRKGKIYVSKNKRMAQEILWWERQKITFSL